ncbi:hypothetical protein [Streptomyces celluloflavus]|uniref:hypothetical protein n=1 Tax=Streptomyces celluloflavus TaxID=58344 RepID=UPI0036952B78
MTRSSGSGPASAAALQRALAALGAAPTLDRTHRPHGPRPEDASLLLGILLAKAELDAAVRADPGAEPPEGLTALIRGYNTLTRSEERRLRLLALRLVRTAFDITLYEDTGDPCAPAAEDAAMTAANMINAYRLARHSTGPSDQRALLTALESAHQFNRSAAKAIEHARRRLAPASE